MISINDKIMATQSVQKFCAIGSNKLKLLKHGSCIFLCYNEIMNLSSQQTVLCKLLKMFCCFHFILQWALSILESVCAILEEDVGADFSSPFIASG